MRLFFDTNVLISAFAARGLCADLMRMVLTEHDFQTSEVHLVGLRRVLRDRFNAPAVRIDRVEALLRDEAVVERPGDVLSLKVRDPREQLRLIST